MVILGFAKLKRLVVVYLLTLIFLGTNSFAQSPSDFLRLFGGYVQRGIIQAATPEPSDGQPCTLSVPGPGYRVDDGTYVITREAFKYKTDVKSDIKSDLGERAIIADWKILKKVISSATQLSTFIEQVGIPRQADSRCDNYLISNDGLLRQADGSWLFFARHDGTVPENWTVLDTIYSHSLDLGSWNYTAQALVFIPDSISQPSVTERPPALGDPTTPVTTPNVASQSGTMGDAPFTDCDTDMGGDPDPQINPAAKSVDKVDPSLAIPACEAAVRRYSKSDRLLYQLGRAYEKKNDLVAALSQFRKAAQDGYVVAETNLGTRYENGDGVPQDYAQAAFWYRKAAEQGYVPAQIMLRAIYRKAAAHGVVLKQDSLAPQQKMLLTGDDEVDIYTRLEELQKEMGSLVHETTNYIRGQSQLTSLQIKNRIAELQKQINALAITGTTSVQNWKCIVDDVTTAHEHDQGYYPNSSGSSAQWRTIGNISCHFQITDMILWVFSDPGVNEQYPDVQDDPRFQELANIDKGTTIHFDGRAYSDGGHTMCFRAQPFPTTELDLLTRFHRCDQFELLKLR